VKGKVLGELRGVQPSCRGRLPAGAPGATTSGAAVEFWPHEVGKVGGSEGGRGGRVKVFLLAFWSGVQVSERAVQVRPRCRG